MLLDATSFRIGSDDDIVSARHRGRQYVLGLGFTSPEATLVAAAISELARNIVQHAERGEIVLQRLERDGRPGILVIARDDGPGIPEHQRREIEAGEPDDAGRLGLRAVKRLVHDLELVSAAGRGTVVRMTQWKSM